MDIPAMRANFAKAAATGDEAPLYFYSHLFLSHPETRAMFPVSMAHQRDRLFSALGDVVARVDDLDALVPILQQLGRDHRKFGTLSAHYPAVGASLLATLEHFDDEWSPELAKDWTDAYTLVAEVMVAAADEAAEQPAWWDADVVGHEPRAIDVAVLQVRPRARYDYLAGQSLSLETDIRPRLWRYYSPANAPRPDGLMELHVKARDGGPVSSALVRRVRVGDVVRLGPPVGHIALDEGSDRDLLLVAGGMGLAPLKALVDQVARRGPARRVDLFVGARNEDHHYDRADLRRLEQVNPWLAVTLAVSEDKVSS
ncbi:MAG TPA: globin domain-containing protein, partial [Nocardioides sp.]|nr:globin domain-containing protein [Nocardioides sp.]